MPDLFTIPGAPAELLARINERRAQMAPGMTMMADPPAPPADPVVDQDEPLGPAGVKALQQERDARGELEKQLKAMQDQFTGVAEAFGVKVEKGAKPDEALMRLTSTVGAIQDQLSVERLARQHKITDEEDIATLLAVSDGGARAKLAARLAPTSDAPDNELRPRLPKPDGTQGSKGADPIKPDAKPGLSRLTQGVTDALEKLN